RHRNGFTASEHAAVGDGLHLPVVHPATDGWSGRRHRHSGIGCSMARCLGPVAPLHREDAEGELMGEKGFSILETVIGIALLLTITGVAIALLDPGRASFATQLENADMQQRLRVAAGALYGDLVMAGAGAYQGGSRGSLSH